MFRVNIKSKSPYPSDHFFCKYSIPTSLKKIIFVKLNTFEWIQLDKLDEHQC